MDKKIEEASNIVANTFKDTDMDKTPRWAKYLNSDDFISYLPSYEGGKYIDLFTKNLFEHKENNIRYYLYDPTKNGYPKDNKYPLLVWIHGATNSLVGDVCITYSGAELYASKKYQELMGGAYVLVPLANEEMDENGGAKWNSDGSIAGGWSDSYLAPMVELIEYLVKNNKSMGKAFIAGGSSGGYFSFRMLEYKKELFFASIPISSSYIPCEESLKEIDDYGIKVINAIGLHDEFKPEEIGRKELESKFVGFKNIKLYLPEWVRNGDGGVASIFVGIEMGQHCLINQVQANLIFDDGTPYDKTLFPSGVTGFIKDNFKK